MTDLDKVRTKAYVAAKHTLTLRALEARIDCVDAEIRATDTEIEEHKEAVNTLKNLKAEAAAVLSGYKKAFAEKR